MRVTVEIPDSLIKDLSKVTGENAEKISEIWVKQIDRFSNSIRDSDRSKDSEAIT